MAKQVAKNQVTINQYTAFQAAYDYYNNKLFSGELPQVMLTFSRHSKAYGFFVANQWNDKTGTQVHEVALNPDYMKADSRTLLDVYSTLVHEMVHVWQYTFGNPSRPGYHDKEYSVKMEEIGLMTSNTGKVGGKRVGQKMSHYIMGGGKFEKAFDAMPDKAALPYEALGILNPAKKAKKAKVSKVKFVCPVCGQVVWGKPDSRVMCADCQEIMEAEGIEVDLPVEKPEVLPVEKKAANNEPTAKTTKTASKSAAKKSEVKKPAANDKQLKNILETITTYTRLMAKDENDSKAGEFIELRLKAYATARKLAASLNIAKDKIDEMIANARRNGKASAEA